LNAQKPLSLHMNNKVVRMTFSERQENGEIALDQGS